MAWAKPVILLAFISVCTAASIFDDELIGRSEGEECDSSVIETMAQYGVNTSSLRCLSDSQERGFHEKRGLQLFRRSCCGVSCAWMASELGVEPSTLICPT